MNTKKFKFNLIGEEFTLPSKYLKTENYRGEPIPNPFIDLNHVAAASVIKQYIKKKYPKVVVSSTSESFSMGNAVTINLSDEIGNGVPSQIYNDVLSFSGMFKYGHFNSMEDIYEMNSNEYTSEKGTTIEMGVKYVSVVNSPSFGSVPGIITMIREYTTTDKYSGGRVSLEKAIETIKSYSISDVKINKALTIMNS